MNETNKIMMNRIITTGKPVFPNAPKPAATDSTQQSSFADILNQKINANEGVKFSKHAEERLKSRNITLDAAKMEKLNDAIAKAEQKGVKDSLVLMDNLALVVSVKNKTVITAVNHDELKNNVFTNIDGAVIV